MKTNSYRLRILGGLLCLTMMLPGLGHGQVNSWTNGLGGTFKWETNSNWSLGVVPTNTHSAIFVTNTATLGLRNVVIDSITPTGNRSVSNLTVSAPANRTNVVIVSDTGTTNGLSIINTLTISARGGVSVTNSILNFSGSSSSRGFLNDGTMTLNSGTINSFATMSNHIGSAASGEMRIEGGTWASVWHATVGANSSARGTLTISGGTVSFDTVNGSGTRDFTIGAAAASTGTVWLTGGKLLVQAQNLVQADMNLGLSGVGQMTVSNGTWICDQLNMAVNAGSQGTLTIAGGTNHMKGIFATSIGGSGTAAVWQTGGELFLSNGLFIASTSQMTVSGGTWRVRYAGFNNGILGSLTIAGGTNTIDLGLGVSGKIWLKDGFLYTTNVALNNGTLNLTGQITTSNGIWFTTNVFVSGGTLTIAGASNLLGGTTLRVGVLNGATGTVVVSSGLLVVTNPSNTASLEVRTGTLTMNGGSVFADRLIATSVRGGFILNGGEFTTRATAVTNGQVFSVGGVGNSATLNLIGGTHSFSNGMVVGSSAGSTGTVWMSATQLLLTTATTTIGGSGLGQMIVSNGIWSSRSTAIAFAAGSRGTLTVIGGTSSVYSNMTLGNFDCTATGIVNVIGGTLAVTNATINAALEVRSGTLTVIGGLLRADLLYVTNACARFIATPGTYIIGSINLTSGFDADGDGLANDFEQTYGFDPFSPTEAGEDPDGDGQSNLQEFLAGTDPTNSASFFRITAIAREGNDIRITWATVGGTTNRVLVSPGAADGSYTNDFSNLGPVIFVAGTGATTTNSLDSGGATISPSRYYTVVRGLGFASGARFLFDAGHAETAGNADWIVDADVRNIFWNNTGTFTLTGNDSNAQRIPTPAASGIISNTVETYWDGGLSAWAVDLVKRGHTVETLPAGRQFTYGTTNDQDLANYDVLVVDEPNILFTLAEKQALVNFVGNGGGLFLIADHTSSDRNGDGVDSPVIWMDFLTNNLITNNPFGIIFPSSSASGTNKFNHDIAGDPILNGPVGLATNTAYFSGNRFQIDHTKNPTVISHMWFGTIGQSNTLCAVASLLYGNGRVVVCGDSSPMEDGTGDPGDTIFNGYTEDLGDTNRIWILNASEWLAAPFP